MSILLMISLILFRFLQSIVLLVILDMSNCFMEIPTISFFMEVFFGWDVGISFSQLLSWNCPLKPQDYPSLETIESASSMTQEPKAPFGHLLVLLTKP